MTSDTDEDLAHKLAELRAEFPGWMIEAPAEGRPPLLATRTGRGGPLALGASSYGEMRGLLDEADAIDCRHAASELGEALRARGAEAIVRGVSLSTLTRAGILRIVNARHGMFRWSSGMALGPITDVEGSADRMMPVLGMGRRNAR